MILDAKIVSELVGRPHGKLLGLVLVTTNVSEFARVPGLRVENWLD